MVAGLDRIHGPPIELPVAVNVSCYIQFCTGLCPCERREAKAKEKREQIKGVFHEKPTFLKNLALAGRPEKQDRKTIGSPKRHSPELHTTRIVRNLSNGRSCLPFCSKEPSEIGQTQKPKTPLPASSGCIVANPSPTPPEPVRGLFKGGKTGSCPDGRSAANYHMAHASLRRRVVR